MDLAHYLAQGAVCMDLVPHERDEAMRVLLEELVASGALTSDVVDGAFDAIVTRERLGSTAIGRGAAVPHARVDGLERVVVAFGYSAGGIEFKALDRGLVHQVFLVLAPTDAADEYMGVMERITRLVQSDDFLRFAAGLSSSAELVDLVKEMTS